MNWRDDAKADSYSRIPQPVSLPLPEDIANFAATFAQEASRRFVNACCTRSNDALVSISTDVIRRGVPHEVPGGEAGRDAEVLVAADPHHAEVLAVDERRRGKPIGETRNERWAVTPLAIVIAFSVERSML
jgi:hypothetical protein